MQGLAVIGLWNAPAFQMLFCDHGPNVDTLNVCTVVPSTNVESKTLIGQALTGKPRGGKFVFHTPHIVENSDV